MTMAEFLAAALAGDVAALAALEALRMLPSRQAVDLLRYLTGGRD